MFTNVNSTTSYVCFVSSNLADSTVAKWSVFVDGFGTSRSILPHAYLGGCIHFYEYVHQSDVNAPILTKWNDILDASYYWGFSNWYPICDFTLLGDFQLIPSSSNLYFAKSIQVST